MVCLETTLTLTPEKRVNGLNLRGNKLEAARGGRTARYIRGLMPSLRPAEANVAEVMLERIDDPGGWSAGELAAAAGVSRATVIRTCQSLGFDGLTELRGVLEREREGDELEPGKELDTDTALDRTIASGIEQLAHMAALLDREEFARAVDALAAARRVLVVSLADLSFLGQYAVYHFALVGRSAEAPPDVIAMHATATTLEEGDVCLAIGHTGKNGLTLNVVDAAQAAGATAISVSSYARGPLQDIADIQLTVGVSEPNPELLTVTRIAQLLIVDALKTALAQRFDVSAGGPDMLRVIAHYTYRPPRRRR
jgi:RpiR family carbohydrate utilization transcriptional regulator